jgi:nucleotide-binding universal stress UspA family protein
MTRAEHPFELKTIVIATDLTHSGSCALGYAKRLAKLQGSKLVVVHAIDPAGYAFPEGMPEPAGADQNAHETLKQIEREISHQGIPIHSVIETGMIYDRILEAALDHQADLLVLGTRAVAKVGRAALGTVARRLLATAPFPILTVPPAADGDFELAGHWQNVLVATDFSEASLAGLNRAQSLVGGQLMVVHAVENAATGNRETHLERLRFLAPFNESHTVPVAHMITPGEAGRVITEQADRMHADLVVLGAPADELQDEDFATSTVLQVVSSVSCPVLCVPPNRSASMANVLNELALST